MTRNAFDELTRHAPGPTADIETLFPDLATPRPKRYIRRPAILVGSVAAVTATVLFIPLMLPGGTASAAALDNLSVTAGRQPGQAPVGIRHQVVVDRQPGMGNRTQESWTLADGTSWRRDTRSDGSLDYMKLPPIYEALAPATVSLLPTDPGTMDAVVRKQVSGSSSTNEAVFVFYGDALRLGYVPPSVRQAMLIAMKRLPHITTEKAATIEGSQCLKVTYSEPLRVFVSQYYCFDEATASITEEGSTAFGSINFRSTVTVSDYVAAVPADVKSKAVDYTGPNGGPSQVPSPTASPS